MIPIEPNQKFGFGSNNFKRNEKINRKRIANDGLSQLVNNMLFVPNKKCKGDLENVEMTEAAVTGATGELNPRSIVKNIADVKSITKIAKISIRNAISKKLHLEMP